MINPLAAAYLKRKRDAEFQMPEDPDAFIADLSKRVDAQNAADYEGDGPQRSDDLASSPVSPLPPPAAGRPPKITVTRGPVKESPSDQVRAYLLKRMNQKPEAKGDSDALRSARAADSLFGAGAEISNLYLQLRKLPGTRKGTNFAGDVMANEVANRTEKLKDQAGRDAVARDLFERESIEAKSEADREARGYDAMMKLRQEAAEKGKEFNFKVEESKRKAGESDREFNARLAKEAADREADAKRLDLEERRLKQQGALGWGAIAAGKERAKEAHPKDVGLAAGWEVEPGAQPSKKQLEDHAERVDAAQSMKGITSEMRGLLKDSNAFQRLAPGTVKSLMDQLSQEATLEGKNIGQLGALSGPDMGIMDAIISNPSKAASMTRDVERILNGVDNWVDRRVNSKATAIGVKKSGGKSTTPAAKPGQMTVFDKEHGKNITVSEALARKMLAAGSAEVAR